MDGLMQLRNEIAQAAESLKRTFTRLRRDPSGRPTQDKGDPEPRWRKVLLRCLIGINVVLLVSWGTFAIKPAWLSHLKGLFSSHPPAPVVQKKSAPTTVTPRQQQVVQRATPAVQEPTTLPQEMTKSQPVVPPKVEKPQTITPPASLPATIQDQELDDYLEIGALYAQKGKYDKAEELFQKVTKENPSSAKAHNNLGFVYLKQEKYELAEKEFKEALRLDSASVLPYYNMACLYSRKGMEVEALIYLKRALKRDARVKLWAMTDEDFDSLRSDVVFEELLGISSPQTEETFTKEGVRERENAQERERTVIPQGIQIPLNTTAPEELEVSEEAEEFQAPDETVMPAEVQPPEEAQGNTAQ